MGHFFVGTHEEVAAIGQGSETRWVARQHGEPMAPQLQIADDFRTEKAVDVAGGGDLEAGPKFFGDDAASDEFAAFKHEDFFSRAGEVSGRHEAVMTCPDNNDVVLCVHRAALLQYLFAWVRLG